MVEEEVGAARLNYKRTTLYLLSRVSVDLLSVLQCLVSVVVKVIRVDRFNACRIPLAHIGVDYGSPATNANLVLIARA